MWQHHQQQQNSYRHWIKYYPLEDFCSSENVHSEQHDDWIIFSCRNAVTYFISFSYKHIENCKEVETTQIWSQTHESNRGFLNGNLIQVRPWNNALLKFCNCQLILAYLTKLCLIVKRKEKLSKTKPGYRIHDCLAMLTENNIINASDWCEW